MFREPASESLETFRNIEDEMQRWLPLNGDSRSDSFACRESYSLLVVSSNLGSLCWSCGFFARRASSSSPWSFHEISACNGRAGSPLSTGLITSEAEIPSVGSQLVLLETVDGSSRFNVRQLGMPRARGR